MSPAIQKPRGLGPALPSPKKIIKAIPVPTIKPFLPRIEHRIIDLPQYVLPGELISLKKKEAFENQVQTETQIAQQKREFAAQPLPFIKTFELEHEIKVTNVQPFALETNLRGEMYQSQLAMQKAREEAKAVAQFNFVANPLPRDEIFFPEKSDKELTHVEGFILATEVRSEERHAFDETNKRRVEEEEALKAKHERREKVYIVL